MKVNELVTLTKLNTEIDRTSALKSGKQFKYEKNGGMNYIINNGPSMKFITYLEFAPKIPRGNHYHKVKEENIIILEGSTTAKYWTLEEPNDVLELQLNEGDIVNILPGVAHVYYSLEGAKAIEFSPQELDIEDQIDV